MKSLTRGELLESALLSLLRSGEKIAATPNGGSIHEAVRVDLA